MCNTAVEDHIWNVVRSEEAEVVWASFCHWECPVRLNSGMWSHSAPANTEERGGEEGEAC